MIEKNQFLKYIEKQNLNSYETNISEVVFKNSIFLKENNLDELIKLSKENDVKNIFFYYEYDSVENYLITEEMIENYDNELINPLKNNIDSYNKEINKLDFTIPLYLTAYVIIQGSFVSIIKQNDWIEELELLEGKEKLESLIYENENILEEYISQKNEKNLERFKTIRNIIINDPEFKKATNHKLRFEYASLFPKKNKEFSDLYNKNRHFFINFIEKIWKEYKNGDDIDWSIFLL